MIPATPSAPASNGVVNLVGAVAREFRQSLPRAAPEGARHGAFVVPDVSSRWFGSLPTRRNLAGNKHAYPKVEKTTVVARQLFYFERGDAL